jgi:hypothetical protein
VFFAFTAKRIDAPLPIYINRIFLVANSQQTPESPQQIAVFSAGMLIPMKPWHSRRQLNGGYRKSI